MPADDASPSNLTTSDGLYADWNNSSDLKCTYLGPKEQDHWDIIWINSSFGKETELLSHFCLNGSFSHLGWDEWHARCYPNYWANLGWHRAAGVWSLFNFIVGTLGNFLTIVAVAYAYQKHR